jgi:hypothetical protein
MSDPLRPVGPERSYLRGLWCLDSCPARWSIPRVAESEPRPSDEDVRAAAEADGWRRDANGVWLCPRHALITTLPEGWRAPDDEDDVDEDGRVAIAQRDATREDLVELFGPAGAAAWPEIKKLVGDGGACVVTVYGRPR